ncbi:MAG: thioredoxin domain-containing protein [Spirochaetales bacterium]|uniref:Thioredoxin domain-containing protein n=1 Tax=Candidatus Thalassospirochaeta sargassi TaxID=3119039 RepID=A0AAJ1IBY4_9SPIO|nr:thioredoxin domain-containing protein [Spirochaetales bacterium]
MSDKKLSDQRSILRLVIIILILNTVSILGVFFVLNNRIDKQGETLVQVLTQLTSGGSTVKAQEIILPESEYETLGRFDAPVKMKLVTDIECPHCISLFNMMFPELQDAFIDSGLVELSYYAFPLESIHPKAMPAAKALYCADRQGAFWPLYGYLTENIKKLDMVQINDSPSNVDNDVFNHCMADEEVESAIRAGAAELREAGIKGTPAVIINGMQLNRFRNFDDIRAEIDSELQLRTSKITAAAAVNIIEEGGYKIIDARTAEEFAEGHVGEAINLDVLKYKASIAGIREFDAGMPYIVYCKSGTRSARAWHIMRQEGFGSVVDMHEGYEGWKAAGFVLAE